MATRSTQRDSVTTQRFISVPAAARQMGVSPATLYRLIAEGAFPAVRLRTRLVVPIEVIEEMAAAALAAKATVDPADWVDDVPSAS